MKLLSGGAAQGLVQAMEPQFLRDGGERLEPQFGAVGAMKALLLEGAPCDLVILTAQMVHGLQQAGHLRAGSAAALGEVETGIAVRSGEPLPDVSTPEALREALLKAAEIYFPDPARATAGIHFASVLARLGIADEVCARLRPFPNGLTAMRELVGNAPPGSIGCTQVTEIRATPAAVYVAGLPEGCELKTLYSAAVCTHAAQPELAGRFIALIAGPQSSEVRRSLGFGG